MVHPVIFDVFSQQLDELFNSDKYSKKIKEIEPELIATNGKFSQGFKRVVFEDQGEKYVSAFYQDYSELNNVFMFQLLTFKQTGNVSAEIKPFCFLIKIDANELSNVKDKSTDVQFEELKKYFSKYLSLQNFKVQKSVIGQHFDVYKVIKKFVNESCLQINNNVPSFKISENELADKIKKELITRLFNKL